MEGERRKRKGTHVTSTEVITDCFGRCRPNLRMRPRCIGTIWISSRFTHTVSASSRCTLAAMLARNVGCLNSKHRLPSSIPFVFRIKTRRRMRHFHRHSSSLLPPDADQDACANPTARGPAWGRKLHGSSGMRLKRSCPDATLIPWLLPIAGNTPRIPKNRANRGIHGALPRFRAESAQSGL